MSQEQQQGHQSTQQQDEKLLTEFQKTSPEIANTNETQQNQITQIDAEEKYDIEQLVITDQGFPIQINGIKEIEEFLKAGVLKGIENVKIRERFANLITDELVIKFVPLSFWFVFCAKFPGCINTPDPDKFVNNLRHKMSKTYVKLFTALPQPKDELINYLIFSLGYMVHYMFYRYFHKQRFYFDLRFILDCYHIIIFEINGLYVSDFYIRLNIDRLFNNKFLFYENKNKPKKNISKNIEKKNILGIHNYPPPVITQDNHPFFKELSDKFIIKTKQSVTNTEEMKYKELLRENLESKTSKSASLTLNESYNYLQKGDQKPYFGNLRLNCNQISPTVFKVLQYPEMSLPFKKKKMIRHCFENVSEQRDSLMNQLKKFNQRRDEKSEKKLVKVSQKSMIDKFDLRAPDKKHYIKYDNEKYRQLFKEKNDASKLNMYDNLNKMFKGMLDMDYIFQHHQYGMSSLQSSTYILEKHKNADSARIMYDKIDYRTIPESKEEYNKIEDQEEGGDKEKSQQQQRVNVDDPVNQKKKKRLEELFNKKQNQQPAQNTNIEIATELIGNGTQTSIIINQNMNAVQSEKQFVLPSISTNLNMISNQLIAMDSVVEIRSPYQSQQQQSNDQILRGRNASILLNQQFSQKFLPDLFSGKKKQMTIQKDEGMQINRSLQTKVIDHKKNALKFDIEDNQDELQSQLNNNNYDNKELNYLNKQSDYKEKYKNIDKYTNHDENIKDFKSKIQEHQVSNSKLVSKKAKM